MTENLLLFGPDGMDAISKLLGLSKVGQLALHPDRIAVWAVGNGTVDGTVTTTLQAEVSLPRPGCIPVEVDILAEQSTCNFSSFEVALALGLRKIVALDLGSIRRIGSGDSSDHSLVEAHELCSSKPVIFNTLQLVANLAGMLGSDHQVVKRLKARVGGAEDKGMVAGVNGSGDESSSFSVGTGDGNEVGACACEANERILLAQLK